MKTVYLALNAAREILHQKLLYNLMVIGVLLSLFSLALGDLTIGQVSRLISDVGVATVSIVSALIAVLVGSGLIAKDVERKTLYFVLSKPVTRTQFLIGKWLGLIGVILLNAILLTAIVALLLRMYGLAPPANLFWAIVGGVFEAMVLGAIAVCFSTFTTPMLSTVFAFAAFVLGHLVRHLEFPRQTGEALLVLGKFAKVVVPDLELLNLRSSVVDGAQATFGDLVPAFAYASGYTVVVLVIAATLFRVRDLK